MENIINNGSVEERTVIVVGRGMLLLIEDVYFGAGFVRIYLMKRKYLDIK